MSSKITYLTFTNERMCHLAATAWPDSVDVQPSQSSVGRACRAIQDMVSLFSFSQRHLQRSHPFTALFGFVSGKALLARLHRGQDYAQQWQDLEAHLAALAEVKKSWALAAYFEWALTNGIVELQYARTSSPGRALSLAPEENKAFLQAWNLKAATFNKHVTDLLEKSRPPSPSKGILRLDRDKGLPRQVQVPLTSYRDESSTTTDYNQPRVPAGALQFTSSGRIDIPVDPRSSGHCVMSGNGSIEQQATVVQGEPLDSLFLPYDAVAANPQDHTAVMPPFAMNGQAFPQGNAYPSFQPYPTAENNLMDLALLDGGFDGRTWESFGLEFSKSVCHFCFYEAILICVIVLFSKLDRDAGNFRSAVVACSCD